MKRKINGADIYDANKLYRAFVAAKDGSSWKGEVQRYELNWLLETIRLQEDLKNKTYKTGPTSSFVIRERGHIRHIVGNNIRDRVVRHSLCDNVLLPTVEPYLIYANGASQVGKGVSFQRSLLESHLHRYYMTRQSNKGYILLMDFSKYYDNIDHDTLFKRLKEVGLDDYSSWLLHLIFKEFQVDVSYLSEEVKTDLRHYKHDSIKYMEVNKDLLTGETMMKKSVNIGDQTSQVVSIFYPTPIDNYIKSVCGIKYYGRYMDDSYIIADTKEELLDILDGVKEMAEYLGIFINEKKTRIAKLENGFRFLQIQYILTDSGHLIRKINPKRLTAMRRKLKKLKKMVDRGERDYKPIEDMYRSWMGRHKKYMSKIQRENLDKLFTELFEDHRRIQNDDNTGRRDKNRKRYTQWKQLYRSERVPTECFESFRPNESRYYGWDNRRVDGKYSMYEFLEGI